MGKVFSHIQCSMRVKIKWQKVLLVLREKRHLLLKSQVCALRFQSFNFDHECTVFIFKMRTLVLFVRPLTTRVLDLARDRWINYIVHFHQMENPHFCYWAKKNMRNIALRSHTAGLVHREVKLWRHQTWMALLSKSAQWILVSKNNPFARVLRTVCSILILCFIIEFGHCNHLLLQWQQLCRNLCWYLWIGWQNRIDWYVTYT